MEMMITHYCVIRSHQAIVDNQIEYYQENFINFADFIKSLYKKKGLSYPKFYKMDSLSKLGFIAAELILEKINVENYQGDRIGIVLANSSSSLDTDLKFQETISDRSDYFPSPGVFVYTLPNIMIGEISIKHKIKGENAFLITEKFDGSLLFSFVTDLLNNRYVNGCVAGWVELFGDQYEAMMLFIEPKDCQTKLQPESFAVTFSTEMIDHIYHKID